MIIIETCPKCGHNLTDIMLASNPPIPKKECWSCGWSWTGEPEEVVRVPFGGNSLDFVKQPSLNDYLNNFDFEDVRVSKFSQSACDNCSSNPKNGGNGICHCTLGQIQIT